MHLHLFPAFLLLCLTLGCTMSEKEEIELGRKSHAQFEKQSGGLYPDPQVQAYVARVGGNVARYAGRPNLDWQFHVVNSPQVNAFAVPGGYIYITQGLLFRLQNEAQLAGVLGHESAHIAKRHSVKQIENARFWQGGALVAGVVGGLFGYGAVGDVAGVVGQLSTLKYGRDQEKEADLVGLTYLTTANYNPNAMVQTMTILKSASSGKGAPAFLSTHPDPGNRVEYLTKEVRSKYATSSQSGRYGEANFREVILSRRAAAAAAASPRPMDWCTTCALERQGHRRLASGPKVGPFAELLHE